MSTLFGKPKAQKIDAPPIPSVKATPTEEEKAKAEQNEAKKRRASLAKTVLTSGDPEDKLKTKLG